MLSFFAPFLPKRVQKNRKLPRWGIRERVLSNMCCVMGYAGHDLPKEEFAAWLARTKSRGPDDTRILEGPFGLLGFNRLAIMGLTEEGMQPFTRSGDTVVCNGEPYGFRTEKRRLEEKGHIFQSDADYELLLPMYSEYGLDLFGYKYTDFAPDADAFQWESQKRVRELYMYDVLRADRCISVHSLEARVPFGDLDFARYVLSIDPEKKQNTCGKGKYLLRKPFEGGWPPDSILWREKAVFSDALGHSMVDYLKEYAERVYTDAEFEEKRMAYTHARLFTKESLLYRELFETYYPHQSHMIGDFWMPNRAWENCSVNDPSARLLKNYGASGI